MFFSATPLIKDDKIFDPFFKRFAKHDFVAATVFSKLYYHSENCFNFGNAEMLVHLLAGIWSEISQNFLSTKKEIKFKLDVYFSGGK